VLPSAAEVSAGPGRRAAAAAFRAALGRRATLDDSGLPPGDGRAGLLRAGSSRDGPLRAGTQQAGPGGLDAGVWRGIEVTLMSPARPLRPTHPNETIQNEFVSTDQTSGTGSVGPLDHGAGSIRPGRAPWGRGRLHQNGALGAV
jgi:hypothetical protein